MRGIVCVCEVCGGRGVVCNVCVCEVCVWGERGCVNCVCM